MIEETFTLMPIDLLVYSGRNPRTEMRELEEFAENIKKFGVRQPIVVRPRGEKFEVVTGERRVRASIIAGLKEVPAIIRALTDRQADIERLIENIHRDDLTDAEKGSAVLGLLQYDEFPTVKSIAEMLDKSYRFVMQWVYKSERLSNFVKSSVVRSTLGEYQAYRLMKYEPQAQDKLAEKIIEYALTKDEAIKFLKLYDMNPTGDIDSYAREAKGMKKVELELEKLPEETKEEIERFIEEKKKQTKRERRETLTKARGAKKKRKSRKEKTEKEKPKPLPPLLPEEKKRLEKAREKEIRKILQEREKRGEFMQARAELREEKIELPLTPTIDASAMLSRRSVADEKRLNLFEAKDWMIFTKSWFIHNPPPRDEKEELHPAKFPEPLIKNFIEFFTQPTEIVLDPFLGTGSTLVGCDMSNRQGIGVELEERYADVARRRTKQPVIVGDARNLDELDILKDLKGKIDFAITSPPYWNMLKKSRGHVRSVSKIREELGADVFYSGKMENLENVEDYEEYLNALHLIFSKVHKLLRPNRYLVVIIQNILTEEGEMKPVAWDLAKKLSGLFLLKQERIWCQDNKPLGCWGYPYRYVSNVHHHYCLVFERV